ncbi:DEAD/DEAH box helicase [candidate division KSB1 bacterium]|nr:DEAD/DEAH box helicase [candidate division KSB1 bacterium]
MNLLQVLDQLKRDSEFMQNITHWETIPAQEAQWAEFPTKFRQELITALNQHGIKRLFSHQAEAIQQILNGKNVVVVTPTASGKTLCYNLPVLNQVLENPEARALYLFPTKALSQDQVAELQDIIKQLGDKINFDIRAFTFDGDTPASARKAIRSAGHIVVTNPDMLHQGILPHHTKWVKLFENLKYIVIDELHHYRGVFGSHLANVLRRLKRICQFYGAQPQFICCSATIANPAELAQEILEEKVVLVNKNGAPRGEKHFLFYNPPVVNRELGIRKSSVKEARDIAKRFLLNKIQTIVFTRSRLRVEILVTYLKELMQWAGKSPQLVRGYRGGYLPTERRAIEHGLRNGEILGVVSTNALELGIDIGQLEAAVMAGYPGRIASTWQQAGRAGRRSGVSVAVLVASSSPIDQFIINQPEYFFEKSPEAGSIDPNNLIILLSHVKCAAFELPFTDNEKFGVETTREVLEYLEENQILHHVDGKWHWMTEVYPAEQISLRSATPENVVIIDTTEKERVIGEVNLLDAPMLVHHDAIYIHEGHQFHVDKLDWDRKKAYVHQVQVDYYTDAHTSTDIKVLDIFEEQALNDGKRVHGEVNVTRLTSDFKKIKFHTHENVGYGKIELPEISMHTTSYWFEFPDDAAKRLSLSSDTLGEGLRSLANVLHHVTAILMMCDIRDIQIVPMVRSPFSQEPTIYIYDNHAGGVGFSRKIYYMHEDLLHAAKDLILKCNCKNGCPSCVGPVLEVGERGKESALELIRLALK